MNPEEEPSVQQVQIEGEEHFNQHLIDIKKEDRGQKCKLNQLDDFKRYWETSSKSKKKKVQAPSLAYTAGSPVRGGHLSTHDSSEENLKELISSKIAHIQLGDACLMKNSTGKQPQKAFANVSKILNLSS